MTAGAHGSTARIGDGRRAATRAAWAALGGDAADADAVDLRGPAGVLPARLPVTDLAVACVAAAGLAAVELARARGLAPAGPLVVDSRAVAVAFTSERHLRLDGRAFTSFAPLSRFWPAVDGFVRTHANYPHHRRRLLTTLGLDPARADDTLVDAVADRIRALPATGIEARVSAAGGLAVATRTPAEWDDHPQAASVAAEPLVRLDTDAPGPARRLPPAPDGLPAHGVRVLDLTRVIAGPVATRFLALLGADVLRVDPPGLPEIAAQHLDTGFGKRSTLLDLGRPADLDRLHALLAEADVLVTGYRPTALDRFGLSSEVLRRRRDLVVARLSAWGPTGPWAGRRGFDSLVQAATGIADVERRPDGTPGALPAQALDHGTGYLLAAAVLRALALRARHGGARSVELSLARTARWLRHDLPPGRSTVDAAPDPDDWCDERDGPTGRLRYALPPVSVPGGPGTWATAPTPWGGDAAGWLPR